MVQNRTFLIKRGGHRSPPFFFLLLASILLLAIQSFGQSVLNSDKRAPKISIGLHQAAFRLAAGGYGLSVAYMNRGWEVGAGGEIFNYRNGGMVYARYYLPKPSGKVETFVGIRAGHYYDSAHIGFRPSYSWTIYPSIGAKLKLYRSLWMQGQLGAGYSSFFRPGGSPVFIPTWVPLFMLQYGLCYDIPLQKRAPTPSYPARDTTHHKAGERFSLLFHAATGIELFTRPSVSRFTGGIGFDLTPNLTLTARHQAIRTFAGLKYGKTQLGVRWMPGHRPGLRWIGSLEAGHVGSLLNIQTPIGAIGITAGQHLQYPITRWIAVDAGFQYSWIKAPRPLQPYTDDFEINMGLVFRPGRFK